MSTAGYYNPGQGYVVMSVSQTHLTSSCSDIVSVQHVLFKLTKPAPK